MPTSIRTYLHNDIEEYREVLGEDSAELLALKLLISIQASVASMGGGLVFLHLKDMESFEEREDEMVDAIFHASMQRFLTTVTDEGESIYLSILQVSGVSVDHDSGIRTMSLEVAGISGEISVFDITLGEAIEKLSAEFEETVS